MRGADRNLFQRSPALRAGLLPAAKPKVAAPGFSPGCPLSDAARAELARHAYTVTDAETSRTVESWIARATCEECERDALRAHRIDIALVVMVWMPSRVRTEGQATVEMIDDDGLTVYGEAPFIHRADIPAAVRTAVAQAVRAFPHRAGVPITIEGLPEGAVVLVDNQPVGMLPFVGHIQAGQHRVTVFRQGFHSQERAFDLDLTDEPIAWHVDLDRDPSAPVDPQAASAGDDGSADSDGERGRGLWWLGPTTLGVVAVGLGTVPFVSIARYEPRDDYAPGQHYRRSALEARPVIATSIAGGLALVGSITWAVVGAKHRHSRTEVSLSPGYLQLSAHF